MDQGGSHQTPFVLGLTGPIACGKTTVGDVLLRLGAHARIDADGVVHELLGSNTDTARAVRARFGDDLRDSSGGIDRRRLADLVFGDPHALATLESIVHPAVDTCIRSRLAALSGSRGVVVIDAVKLLQSNLLQMCQDVWVVRCDPGPQLRRLTETRHMSEQEARARLSAQPSFDHPAVSRVIDNSASLDQLRRQIELAWRDLQARVQQAG